MTYIREWPELSTYDIATIQAQTIPSPALSPCQTLKILRVHARSGGVPFICMMAFLLNPALKQARMLDTEKALHPLGGDEAVKEFKVYKLLCFP